jgi:dipeptidyl-peptidase 4
MRVRFLSCLALTGMLLAQPGTLLFAQDRLPSMPNFAQYEAAGRKFSGWIGAVRGGAIPTQWSEDGKTLYYSKGGKRFTFDMATRQSKETQAEPPNRPNVRTRMRPGVERGRQAASALSPDGKTKAFYQDNNLYLSDANGSNAKPITTDGSREKRIKNGTGSWVYGEELDQVTAFWWSPDSTKLAYYRFDESQVKDYYLVTRSLPYQSELDAEPYPKAGAPNPIVDVFVYDLTTKQTAKVDVRSGKPFDNDALGYYVYDVRWSPDGTELLFHRTNRLQNVMELTAANPKTGACRVIFREEWKPSWVEIHPKMQFLQDNNRFLLLSERTGFRNIYLMDMSGKTLAPITKHPFEVESIVDVDEKSGTIHYMARDGDNPLKLQLHRVKMDGTGDKRLTDPAYTHRVQLSPDGSAFVDSYEAHNKPLATRLMDKDGKLVADLSESPALPEGFPTAELFRFKAADGTTDLYGILHKPSNFSPDKKYPLLVGVYGGPESGSVSESFAMPSRLAELGFLVASFDNRGVQGRGKAFMDALYGKCGVVEIDDQAAGVKFLRQRAYVDGSKVGIHGVSYGGYASAMCLLRHPDVFQAACAQSSVTDWRNYDTIYTERYMGLPQENGSGYDAGSAMTYAKNLKGRLMLFYGTADNNVHPANTHQLIAALQRAGKSFDLQIAPDQGHTGLNTSRMMEFFIENLVLKTTTNTTDTTQNK